MSIPLAAITDSLPTVELGRSLVFLPLSEARPRLHGGIAHVTAAAAVSARVDLPSVRGRGSVEA